MDSLSKQRIALVTGASSGIGQATATVLLAQGWQVYGLSRSGSVPVGVKSLLADISVPAEVIAATADLWQECQRLDLVINAAGIGGTGPLEHFPPLEARKIMDTNFMGAFYLAQAVLPYFRQQGSGKLVFVSSIAGLMGIPFHSLYSASKFALEALVESLRYELTGMNIDIVSICPGDTNTPIIGRQYRVAYQDVSAEYAANYQRADKNMIESVKNGIAAESVATAIVRIAVKSHPKVRYPVGKWLQRVSPLIKRFLPAAWFERIMAGYYELR